MAKLTVRDLNTHGKRVFVRVDYNVPLEEQDGQMVITDETRIVETLPTLRLLMETVIPQQSSMDGFEVEHDFLHLGRRTMLLNARLVRYKDHSSATILIVLAGLCAWWRHNRVLAGVGLVALAAAIGIIIWGSLIDYLRWRDTPYPQNQVTYLGTFFGFLGALCICLAFGLLGAGVWVVRFVRRRQAARARWAREPMAFSRPGR